MMKLLMLAAAMSPNAAPVLLLNVTYAAVTSTDGWRNRAIESVDKHPHRQLKSSATNERWLHREGQNLQNLRPGTKFSAVAAELFFTLKLTVMADRNQQGMGNQDQDSSSNQQGMGGLGNQQQTSSQGSYGNDRGGSGSGDMSNSDLSDDDMGGGMGSSDRSSGGMGNQSQTSGTQSGGLGRDADMGMSSGDSGAGGSVADSSSDRSSGGGM